MPQKSGDQFHNSRRSSIEGSCVAGTKVWARPQLARLDAPDHTQGGVVGLLVESIATRTGYYGTIGTS